jgi:hypothetical protein
MHKNEILIPRLQAITLVRDGHGTLQKDSPERERKGKQGIFSAKR